MKYSLKPFFNLSPLVWENEDWPELGGDQGLNVYRDGSKIAVEAPVPGMEADQIEVSFEDGILRINAKKEDSEEKKLKSRQIYRWSKASSFSYSTSLPWPINAKTIKAKVRNGVVTISADMAEEAKARTIRVEAEDK